MRRINVSTGGFNNQKAGITSRDYIDAGIKNIELSGGKYDPNILNNINNLRSEAYFSIHNYFPPPNKSFVLNLGSTNKYIYEKSINHVKNAIDLCKKIKSEEYSIHSGFRLDPEVDELGAKISSKRKLIPKKECEDKFYSALEEINIYGKLNGVKIYIENNVVTKGNHKQFNENPFLLSDAKDFFSFLEKCPNDIKLLIDVAHLKVSANTLNFNPKDLLNSLKNETSAYHLSDNNGLADTNEPITNKSWFWDYINRKADFYTLEIYRKSPLFLHKQMKLVSTNI